MAGRYDLSQAVQTLNPVGAMQAGQQMAANKLNLQDAGMQMEHKQQLGGIRQQAVGAEGGYTPEAHKQLLMDAGFFEEAQDMDDLASKKVTNQQQVMEKAFGIIQKTGDLVNKMGAPAWAPFRESLIRIGMADDETLPVEFNEQAAAIAQNFGANASDAFKVITQRSGDMAQDITNINGKITPGKPYKANEGKGNQPTALQKNVPFVASKLGISEGEATQMLMDSKGKSDQSAYDGFLQTALRESMGDAEEAAATAQSLMGVRKKYLDSLNGSKPSSTGGGQKFQEGKIYTDAQGNKAKRVNGKWEPVQ